MTTEASREQFGKDIAFGMQQTFACWATDFIDPYVGEKIQRRFEDATHKMPKGSTWVGEITGDTAAFFAFLGVQKFVPSLTHGLKHVARRSLDPLLERTGRKELKEWSEKEHIAPESRKYLEKMEEWKDFQADNIAKSAIISTSSIAFNVATQKAMRNTHKLWIIALAKVAGATITVLGMLGLRFAIPRTTKQLDEELSHRYFSPLIRKTQKLFGAEMDEKPESHHDREPHVRRQERRRQASEQAMPER